MQNVTCNYTNHILLQKKKKAKTKSEREKKGFLIYFLIRGGGGSSFLALHSRAVLHSVSISLISVPKSSFNVYIKYGSLLSGQEL